MMKTFTLMAIAALTAASAQAGELEFSYNIEGEPASYYGTKKKENYDIAIKIDNPALAGKKILGISVPVNGDAALYANPSAFLTSELKLERIDGVRVNVPDICSVEATLADGILTATFTEPYTMTADPVFVGYSIEVTELKEDSKTPIAVVPGTNQDGLWLHSSRSQLKWANYVDKVNQGMQSCMIVTLEGDFPAESAALTLPGRTACLTNQENDYAFTVVNGGTSAIEKIDYTWSIADKSGEGSYTFENPIRGSLGAIGTSTMTIPAIDDKGLHQLTLTLTKVNGVENTNAGASATAEVIFAPAIPVNRPLVEEYTGLWCGWCVRGYAALEYLGEEYPENFVAGAWHNGDPMAISSAYPNGVGGFPYAYINRTVGLDPVDIESTWAALRRQPVDMSVKCEVAFTDDTKNEIQATATVNSITDTDKSYALGFMLIADGLTDPDWAQSNYFSGDKNAANAQLPEKYRDMFVNAGGAVKGLIFNDVVVSTEHVMGVPKSLPENIKAFEDNSYTVKYDISDIRNIFVKVTESEPDANVIPIDKSKMRVIAFIIDASTGAIVNSCKSGYAGGDSGVGTINGNVEIAKTVWYDLQGRAVQTPVRGGIYVRMQTLTDGSVRIAKVAVR